MLSFSLESNEIMVTSNLNLLIFSRESNRDFSLGHVTVCASWKVQPTFFKFVVCNPCYSSSSLTILVPLWFIIISLVFFYLNKLLFSGFFNLTVILYVAKITLTALPAFRKRLFCSLRIPRHFSPVQLALNYTWQKAVLVLSKAVLHSWQLSASFFVGKISSIQEEHSGDGQLPWNNGEK